MRVPISALHASKLDLLAKLFYKGESVILFREPGNKFMLLLPNNRRVYVESEDMLEWEPDYAPTR